MLNIGQPANRRGVTALEILVVSFCIAALAALVLSGIASARSTARLNDCRNRLRQLGIATHNFESAHRGMPRGFSHFSDLLPYLENQTLYDKWSSMNGLEHLKHVSTQEGTLTQFVCPADSLARVEDFNFSYHLNSGTKWGYDEKWFPYNGMVAGWLGSHSVVFQNVSDGTSNTALYSERLVKVALGRGPISERDAVGAQNQGRLWWQLPNHYSFGDEQQLVANCRIPANRTTFGQPHDPRPISLFSGIPSWYDHMLAPNSPACTGESGRRTVVATSSHSGGVNVLLVDGSVKFANESIDYTVWMALGTRAGNEAFSLDW